LLQEYIWFKFVIRLACNNNLTLDHHFLLIGYGGESKIRFSFLLTFFSAKKVSKKRCLAGPTSSRPLLLAALIKEWQESFLQLVELLRSILKMEEVNTPQPWSLKTCCYLHHQKKRKRFLLSFYEP
jgi:hypothetical protein